MRGRRKKLIAACAGLPLTIITSRALADNDTWTGTTGNWSSAAAWSLGRSPTNTDNVFLTQTDATNRTVALDVATTVAAFTIDSTGTGFMTLGGFSGNITVTGDAYIGLSGAASVTATAATENVAGNLYVGFNPSSNGFFSENGSTFSASNLFVGGSSSGPGGTGRISITDFASVANSLKIWNTPGTVVTFAGGTLSVGTLDTSSNPSAFSWQTGFLNFTDSSGFTLSKNNIGASYIISTNKYLTVANTLFLPSGTSLTLSFSNITASAIDTTGNPSGFIWNNGRLTLTSASGFTPSATNLGSSIFLSSGRTLVITNGLTLPAGTNFTLSGGSLTAATIDTTGNPSGLTWTAGLLDVTTGFTATAANIGASPTISTGKTLSVGSSLTIPSGTNFTINGGAVSSASLNVSGGTVTLSSGVLGTSTLSVGSKTTGIFTQNGGTNSASTQIQLGSAAAGDGTYNLLSGNATAAGIFIGGGPNSAGGTGALNVSGGSLTDSGNLKLWNTGTSRLALSGGTLNVKTIDFSGHTERFAWTGGTLSFPPFSTGSELFLDTIFSNQTLVTGQILSATNLWVGLPTASSLTINGGIFTAGQLDIKGNVTLSAGALQTDLSPEQIGVGSSTTVTQTGGTHSALNIVFGVTNIGFNITYNLYGGTLFASNSELIGGSGTAVFNQTAGSNTVSSSPSSNLIQIGETSANGSYNLSGGTVSTPNTYIGGDPGGGSLGLGVLNVSGGSYTSSSLLKLWNSTFNSGISLTGGTITTQTLDTNNNAAQFSWSAGTLVITNSTGFTLGASTLGTTRALGTDQNLRVSAGALTIPSGTTLNLNGGAITASSMTIGGTYNQSSGATSIPTFTVSAGGNFNASTIVATTLGITGKATLAASAGASRLSSLTITSPGKFELNNNPLIIDYTTTSPASTIRGYLTTGYNAGKWDGVGIDSSAAHTDINKRSALGYAEAADVGITTLGGQTISGKAVLVKYTYYGDSSLDGKVDLGNDFNLFLQGFAATNASSWVLGDYNYDGRVDSSDFDLFLDSYKSQNGSLGDLDQVIQASPLLSQAQKAQFLSAVPEPSSLAALSAATCLLAASRRRRGTWTQ
jgi:fibronectin-binding autotransporter adhesin